MNIEMCAWLLVTMDPNMCDQTLVSAPEAIFSYLYAKGTA